MHSSRFVMFTRWTYLNNLCQLYSNCGQGFDRIVALSYENDKALFMQTQSDQKP
jgi:hypothetical protein